MDTTSPQERAASGVQHERRLAAVVFTDVVGYSSRMRADEVDTIRRVDADLQRMRVLCAARGGRCINSMGDGLMLAFASAVEAVSFAMDVQREFALRSAEPGEPQPLSHRIGVHVGDVVRTPDGTLAGDGVNIAARLEGNAPKGGVCISQAVRDTVKGKLAMVAVYAGAQSFKNIGEPIEVWHWHPSGASAISAPAPVAKDDAAQAGGMHARRKLVLGGLGAVAAAAGGGLYVARDFFDGRGGAALDPKSIAVLPFLNMSDDKDAAYFAEGIHEDLLTQLALVGQLKVVSRTSVMEYRNTTKKMSQIGRELRVASLVEGSVRRAGDTVRVTAQLVDSQADKHMWAANYDRSLHDVFKVQSELASEIARSLKVSLTAAEQMHLSMPATRNEEAYEFFLRHEQLLRDVAGTYRSVPTVTERIGLLERAVALDPDFALAWAKLGAEHARAHAFRMADADESRARAKAAVDRAKALAPGDLQIGIEEAAVQLYALDDPQAAIATYRRVIASAPYNIEALYGLAEVLNEGARDRDAADVLERGLSVDARHGATITRLSDTYARYRHFDRALELQRRLIDLRPGAAEQRADYGYVSYLKSGSWDAYDAWRAMAPKDSEQRSVRVRNVDIERAIARGNAAEVHRLIDVDSSDWPRSQDRGETAGGLLAQHALAWHAFGDAVQARVSAARALPFLQESMRRDPRSSAAADSAAQMHALLSQREAAMSAADNAVDACMPSRSEYRIELQRRRIVHVYALLGDTAKAVALLRVQAGHPGFCIHEMRVALPLASLWKHADFVALVGNSDTNAPLALDTPLRAA